MEIIRWQPFFALLFTSLVLSGCFWNKKDENREPDGVMRLGELVPLDASSDRQFIQVSTHEQIELYETLLNHVHSAKMRGKILTRIADLELIYQEQLADKSLDGNENAAYVANYEKNIALYQALLKDFPHAVHNDAIYYQLAKAYDLSGNQRGALAALRQLVIQFPDSRYANESWFRMGDYYFVLREYRQAEIAFNKVVESAKKTAYFENAVYMKAWSLYKQDKLAESSLVFYGIFDTYMGNFKTLESVAENKRLMVEDSLRMLATIFSQTGGVDALIAFYQDKKKKPYQALIYDALATYYEKKERYLDAIATYRAYIAAYPISDQAPIHANKIMDLMREARFFNKLPDEKVAFVKTYGKQGAYYSVATYASKQYVDAYLLLYLDELGRHYHAEALEKYKRVKRYKVPPKRYMDDLKQSFEQAIHYHEAYIASFWRGFHAPEKAFLIAEAHVKMRETQKAIRAYEYTAYDFGVHPYSEKAAYSAILLYQQLLSKKPKEADQLHHRKLTSELVFVEHFESSQYVRPILLRTTDTFYQQKKYPEAFAQAERFLTAYPDAKKEEKQLLFLVAGHSSFEMNQFATAESYYLQALDSLPKRDKRYKEVFKRTTASIYKQGELLAKEGKKLEAVEQFLRVGKFSPNSSYRKTADFDAITYLIQAEKFERAIALLTDYRARYDRTKTDLDITGKMIACYEGLKQYELAAAELKRVHRDEKDPEKRRQALFLAAEYYEKSNQLDKALDTYRNYSHNYPAPFDLAMETRYKLSEMYRLKKDDTRRRYWLDKVIVADMKAGDKRTTRSKYLAAQSRNVFAEDYYLAYQKIKLTLPLSRSLPKKKDAMEAALKRYQKVIDYGIQEFSTQANYKVAEIYAILSKDIMNSQRPKGLTELELEEYDLILEEQAYPFEEKATEIHESNLQNSWHGNYDQWVQESIQALSRLFPAKYNKEEDLGNERSVIY
ncbi:MAG: tetratricopeptide repeat protein [Cellvibrionales bacterium]|nr:tetratricopeptide repeat protein [Cellvibrionales bacterium]